MGQFNGFRVMVMVLGLVALGCTMLPPWIWEHGSYTAIPEEVYYGLVDLPTLNFLDVQAWASRNWVALVAIGSVWAWGIFFARKVDEESTAAAEQPPQDS